MFRRIVYNILKNCIEASDYKSEIWIETEDTYTGINIHIGNSGSYISEELIRNISKKNFSQGKPSGTGLGLYIVDKLLAKHNSRFEINSNPVDHTTEFTFHIHEDILI